MEGAKLSHFLAEGNVYSTVIQQSQTLSGG